MCEPYAAGYASPATTNTTVPQKSHQQQLNYQIPASALYEAPETDPTGRSGYGRVLTFSFLLFYLVTTHNFALDIL